MDSFFDNDDLGVAFDFLDIEPHHQIDLSSSAIVASTLNCPCPNAGSLKRGIYALHNQLIVFYPSENPSVANSVLPITYSRLDVIEAGPLNANYGFRVTKNDNYFEFFSPNKQIIESWIVALKSICVLTKFHEEYVAIKTIGTGGFATVCLVEQRKSKNMFAVKAFSKKFMLANGKEKAKPSLLNEINMMRSLNHENIVKLYEVYETENSVYLVMELIKGKTLLHILRKDSKRGDSDPKTWQIMYSILSALAHIANQGAMHRDLKPENILIGKGDKVKIADFGLATFIKEKQYIYRKCGTPGYIAPEVFKFNEKNPSTAYDSKCDVFSVGCIFFYMLFGFPFFNGFSVSEIVDMNQNSSATYVENIGLIKRELTNPTGKIDKDALKLLLQLIEIDPAKRITASKSLDHSYFSNILQIRKVSSAGDSLERPFSKVTPIEKIFPFVSKQTSQVTLDRQEDSLGSGSFIIAGANKFTEKDSLYLDIGNMQKGDSLEKSSDSLISPTLKRNESRVGSNPNSITGLTNPKTLLKSMSSNKGGIAGGNQFLKVAIFNNMQKQNEEKEEETEKSEKMEREQRKRFVKRYNTDFIMARPNAVDGFQDEVPKIDESCEVNDRGEEDAHIQTNFDIIMNLSKAKLPSKKAHVY